VNGNPIAQYDVQAGQGAHRAPFRYPIAPEIVMFEMDCSLGCFRELPCFSASETARDALSTWLGPANKSIRPVGGYRKNC